MIVRRFVARSPLPFAAGEVFVWHARPGALRRLVPPWESVEAIGDPGPLRDGERVTLRWRRGLVRSSWVARHEGFEEGRQFCDTQERGPFARWIHTHRFVPDAEGSSFLEDAIEYALPMGRPGDALGRAWLRRRLRSMFAYRHAITAADLARHSEPPGADRRVVAVSGATGLVGTSLCAFLSTGGHRVRRMVRPPGTSRPGEIPWDPEKGVLDPANLEGVDAVVHLAGEGIAGGRWSAARKRRILESRVEGTRLLAEAIASMNRPPRVWLSASAIGYHGGTGDRTVDEWGEAGSGFLAEVARAWEDATRAAERRGVRVVHLRLGVVLSGRGGALAKMVPAFLSGVGGPVGGGEQFVSWIALEDVLGAILFLMGRDDLAGPFHLTAPDPVRQGSLARTLGRVLRRPAVVPLPATAVRLLFGEMGEATLLASQRVVPRRLLEAGFRHRHPDLERAIRLELGRDPEPPPGFEIQD